MRIIDTYPKILPLIDKFSLERWRQYASAISPTLAKQAEEKAKGYSFSEQIEPVPWSVAQTISETRAFGSCIKRELPCTASSF